MSNAGGRRVLLMVLDGVGAGALPDAAVYGDAGACTIGHVAELLHLRLPVLQRLGLGNILPVRGVPPAMAPEALPARLAEKSAGKDSTTGHWEHMGIEREEPFPTYPHGFPPEVVEPFERAIGRRVIGNTVASGTEIIQELGEEHLRTGCPVLYTSQDSVFQLAAHVDVVPRETLYGWCRTARSLLQGRHAVARVIARPFGGGPRAIERVAGRKDFSLDPPRATYLDLLLQRGVTVTGVGKVGDLFAHRGFTTVIPTQGNRATLKAVAHILDAGTPGLLLANLIDFDMEWGHRNDAELFARGLVDFDRELPALMSRLRAGDLLLITADHGCDPTTPGTDHTREYAPLLVWPHPLATQRVPACYEGYFSDVGATSYAALTGEPPPLAGRSLARLEPARGWTQPLPRRSADAARRGEAEAAGREAARILREAFGEAPATAIVLGSGLDGLATETAIPGETQVAYCDLPGWPEATVAGHRGRVIVTRVEGRRVALLCGRAHRYEGHSRSTLQHPLADLSRWGVTNLVLTYAVGALTDTLGVPGFAVVSEVIDLQDGPPRSGQPRVFTLACPRTLELGSAAGLPQVTYAAVGGPQYETRAEVAVLRGLGATVVGMSAAAEVQAARRLGLNLLGLVLVTNKAGEGAVSMDRTTARTGGQLHQEVLRCGAGAVAQLRRYLRQWWHILEQHEE